MIHPKTRKVHRIPESALLYNFNDPLEVPWDEFEKMSAFCGTHFASNTFMANSRVGQKGFHIRQIVVVKTKRGIHWGSRMSASLPESSFFKSCFKEQIGSEFLWIWPLSLSRNQWYTQTEKVRTTGQWRDVVSYEPERSLVNMSPAIIVTPDDISGCDPVDWKHLTSAQRYFVSNLIPFAGVADLKSRGDDWRDKYMKTVDLKQKESNKRKLLFGDWGHGNMDKTDSQSQLVFNTDRACDTPSPEVECRDTVVLLAEQSAERVQKNIVRLMGSTSVQRVGSVYRSVSAPSYDSRKDFHMEIVKRGFFVGSVKRPCSSESRVFLDTIPVECIDKVIAVRCADQMNSKSSKECISNLGNVRLVNKHFYSVVNEFIGSTLYLNKRRVQSCITGHCAEDAAAHCRSIGVRMETLVSECAEHASHWMSYVNMRKMSDSVASSTGATKDKFACEFNVTNIENSISSEIRKCLREWESLNPHLCIDFDEKSIDRSSSGSDSGCGRGAVTSEMMVSEAGI